jgi:ribosomal protein L40E
MTETLTESFCERCGTRYTFQAARPRGSRFGRARTLTKGVRNFVMSEDSFSEAMADARNEDERAVTTVQLDAFHRTFNFCMSCRQYTCSNCWNEQEARCLSCAPITGSLGALEAAGTVVAPEPAQPILASAWPAVDLPVVEAPPVEPEPDASVAAELAAERAAETEAALEFDRTDFHAVADELPAPITPVRGLAPGQSIEDAIAAWESAAPDHEPPAVVEAEALATAPAHEAAAVKREAEALALEPEGAPEPVAEAVEVVPEVRTIAERPVAPEPEPIAIAPEVEAELVAAVPVIVVTEPEPVAIPPAPAPVVEPVAIAPEVEPVAIAPVVEAEPVAAVPVIVVTEPEPVAIPPAPAPVVEPVAASASQAPAAPAISPWLTVAPDNENPPSWPTTPAWPVPSIARDRQTTIAGRTILPEGDAAAVWAASAREVLAVGAPKASVTPTQVQVAPHPCVGCGLPLSANARFCRRCGSRQS